MTCPFCEFIHGDAPKPVGYRESYNAVSFEPLNPVVSGHLLVVPLVHVSDVLESPRVTADTMHYASLVANELGRPCNLITSVGPEATQTVYHLHIHIVPRAAGDGLKLPWSK